MARIQQNVVPDLRAAEAWLHEHGDVAVLNESCSSSIREDTPTRACTLSFGHLVAARGHRRDHETRGNSRLHRIDVVRSLEANDVPLRAQTLQRGLDPGGLGGPAPTKTIQILGSREDALTLP